MTTKNQYAPAPGYRSPMRMWRDILPNERIPSSVQPGRLNYRQERLNLRRYGTLGLPVCEAAVYHHIPGGWRPCAYNPVQDGLCAAHLKKLAEA